ncbi:MAG TPA: BRCT domain-containing protein [Bacteroidota bacterium]|nr:BRCT domain-containing protein [Bacteroidota bacterium]
MKNDISDLDDNGQPNNPAFNWRRNRNKIASSLIGILSGLTVDNELSDTEIFFLQNWLDNQDVKRGDLYDIYEEINIILQDGIITSEEREGLILMLNDCIEYSPRIIDTDSSINEFIGFLKGITGDNEISQEEFSKLRDYLSKYNHILNKWPFDLLYQAINDILHDNNISKSELMELCSLIQQVTGTSFTKYGDAIGGATTMFDAPVPTFSEKNVCLTGQFISGTRSAIKKQIESLGAILQENVTLKTDILIIGTLSSRDWIHTSTGRKIEKAIELKKSGHDLIITNERVALLNSSL